MSYEEITTAKEHMKQCKEAALAYLTRTDEYYSPQEAVSCMISDLGKHPVTKKIIDSQAIKIVATATLMNLTHLSAERFIKGFPDL